MLNFFIAISFLFYIQDPSVSKTISQDTLIKTVNPQFGELLENTYPEYVPSVTIDEFKELNRENLYILDTRGKDEYAVSHLKNAREVGYYWFDMRDVYDIPKNATVITYCAVGNRSSRIAERMIRAGYKNVFVLFGGIFEWVNGGNPVYTQKDIQTSQVHAYSKEWAKWLEKGNKVL